MAGQLICVVLIGLLNQATESAPRAAPPGMLIISIDGMRGDYVANPDKYSLKVPTLRKLMARGSHAKAVRGVFPSVTYPSHTTLITGCRPGKHGILANGIF